MKVRNKNSHNTYYSLHNTSKGFTLLEVIVAMAVLLTGIVGVITLITKGLQTVHATKNSVIAANLGQEGIEIIRGIRDSNWINNSDYDSGINDGNNCASWNSYTLQSCSQSGYTLLWDGTHYNHSTGNISVFKRHINIAHATDSEGVEYLRVQSIVEWDSRNVTVESHLYDWR